MVIMYLLPYGTKWSLCNSISKMATEQYYIWYEMVMVQNTYDTKWFLVMVRNCNFVVRIGKLWYEMVMVRND